MGCPGRPIIKVKQDLPQTLWGRDSYYTFTGKEAEAQRGEAVEGPGWKPDLLDSRLRIRLPQGTAPPKSPSTLTSQDITTSLGSLGKQQRKAEAGQACTLRFFRGRWAGLRPPKCTDHSLPDPAAGLQAQMSSWAR